MAQIGQFIRDATGFSGHVCTLTLDVELTLVPADPSDAENAPDYRVHLASNGNVEVGAGWKRTGEKAGNFVSLLLDDPVFAQPLRANLFQSSDDKSVWSLHWNRPSKRGERD